MPPEEPSPSSSSAKIHCLAEKRRRARINAHLSTLRSMIPHSNKIDKATLLGEVIGHFKHLRTKATDVSRSVPAIPTEVDEVTVESYARQEGTGQLHGCLLDGGEAPFIRASICCDDRPGLLGELMGAFHDLGLRAVRAELATVGGRVRNVFLLCSERGGGSLSSAVDFLRETLGRIARADEGVSCGLTGKRASLMHSQLDFGTVESSIEEENLQNPPY